MTEQTSSPPTQDRALIQGVPRLAWGQGQDCTFAGALAAAMAVTEHPYSYTELMGLSGLAFRVRWSNDEVATQWCPFCAVGEQPHEYQALRALTGWSLPTDVQFGQEERDTSAIRAKVVASIDKGIADVANWSAKARRQEAEVLAEVYQFEARAIANIESALATMTAEQGDEAMVLEGVDSYRVMGPMFESARIVMSYLGETYSPAYVQGISGAAFRIGGICPCAPTCACAMSTQDLLKTFGYEIEHLSLCEEGTDPEKEALQVIERVKDQIRAGRPALVWHAFTWAEWDVVAGFDDETHQFLGRGSYAGLDGYATADQGRMATCGAICPPIGAILVGDKTGTYDAHAAEIAALQEAVAHAHSIENLDKLDGEGWVMLYGLACYDRWISDFETDPPRLPTIGDRYCFGVNRSTHRAAAAFVRELAAKHPAATEPLERASPHFEAEADALNEAANLLFPGWELPQKPSRETNAKAAALLHTARGHYARGIDEIESALAAMGMPAR